MFCKNCGKENPEGTQFCSECGSRLGEEVIQSTVVSSKKKGDMFVIAKVMIPEKLTRDQKKLFEELKNTSLDTNPEFKKYYKYLNK